MRHPPYQPHDLVVLTPDQARGLEDPRMPGDRFHLVRVVADRGGHPDFELVDSGPLALMEALALLVVRRKRRIWSSWHGRVPTERGRES